MLSNNSANGLPPIRNRPINPEGRRRDVIVVGASAGGVMALSDLLASLPSRLAASIGVVLHRSAIPGQLAHVLGRRSTLPVIEPETDMPMKRGHIYLAPPDHHLLFDGQGVMVERGPKEHSTRPAIDPLFRSAAEAYRERVVGVLLTGCGEDGVSGLIAISRAAGVTLAQDPEEAYMPFMPLNAIKYDDVSAVMPIKDLAETLSALTAGRTLKPPRRT